MTEKTKSELRDEIEETLDHIRDNLDNVAEVEITINDLCNLVKEYDQLEE